jgi:hypothetical protein
VCKPAGSSPGDMEPVKAAAAVLLPVVPCPSPPPPPPPPAPAVAPAPAGWALLVVGVLPGGLLAPPSPAVAMLLEAACWRLLGGLLLLRTSRDASRLLMSRPASPTAPPAPGRVRDDASPAAPCCSPASAEAAHTTSPTPLSSPAAAPASAPLPSASRGRHKVAAGRPGGRAGGRRLVPVPSRRIVVPLVTPRVTPVPAGPAPSVLVRVVANLRDVLVPLPSPCCCCSVAGGRVAGRLWVSEKNCCSSGAKDTAPLPSAAAAAAAAAVACLDPNPTAIRAAAAAAPAVVGGSWPPLLALEVLLWADSLRKSRTAPASSPPLAAAPPLPAAAAAAVAAAAAGPVPGGAGLGR